MWGGWRVSPNKTGGITIALYESCTTRPWGHLSYFTLFPDPIWLNLFDRVLLLKTEMKHLSYCLTWSCESYTLMLFMLMFSENIPDEFVMISALCSCSLPGGEGLSGEGPGYPGWACHSAVSGVWLSSTLFPLVQRGWTSHLAQYWQTQTRYGTHVNNMAATGVKWRHDHIL